MFEIIPRMTFLKVFSKHFSIEEEIVGYLERTQKSRSFIKFAASTSRDEIHSSAMYLKKRPNFLNTLIFARSLVNSSTWLANSASRLLTDHVGAIRNQHFRDDNERIAEYAKLILNGESARVPPSMLPETLEVLFESIERKSRPPVEAYQREELCLVLVPGVFNEIFSTTAFERGAKYLSERYKLSYICPSISGRKSSQTNARSLFHSLKAYTELNPKKKLWLLGFSKGGIDALHLMAENPEWAEKHIAGLSTIASPIQGTKTLNEKTKKLIDRLNNITDKVFRREILLFLSEFQASLAKEERDSWFEENHDKLPTTPFYTSLGLFSEWYESHVWMMMAKLLLKIDGQNDGVVELDHSRFPSTFRAMNFGAIKGHHLIGNRSSYYAQEALLEAMFMSLCSGGKL